MGQAGDRLRAVAERLDAKGDELSAKASEVLDRVAAKAEAIADKIEAGEEVTDEDARVDNTLPGDLPENGEQENPPEATQLPS